MEDSSQRSMASTSSGCASATARRSACRAALDTCAQNTLVMTSTHESESNSLQGAKKPGIRCVMWAGRIAHLPAEWPVHILCQCQLACFWQVQPRRHLPAHATVNLG